MWLLLFSVPIFYNLSKTFRLSLAHAVGTKIITIGIVTSIAIIEKFAIAPFIVLFCYFFRVDTTNIAISNEQSFFMKHHAVLCLKI